MNDLSLILLLSLLWLLSLFHAYTRGKTVAYSEFEKRVAACERATQWAQKEQERLFDYGKANE